MLDDLRDIRGHVGSDGSTDLFIVLVFVCRNNSLNNARIEGCLIVYLFTTCTFEILESMMNHLRFAISPIFFNSIFIHRGTFNIW